MLKSIQSTLSEFLQQEINIEKRTLFSIPHKIFFMDFVQSRTMLCQYLFYIFQMLKWVRFR